MRVLVTGGTGFAGRHLVRACAAAGDEVVATARRSGRPPEGAARLVTADLLDAGAARAAVAEAAPERVVHLAAEASVARSWEDPARALDVNVRMTLNVLEAVRAEAPAARVLVTGSGEQYGAVAPHELPITEEQPFRPQNPYAVAKASADLLAGFYADAHGLHAIRARAFNHAGPGQSEVYVISNFARQIAAAEAAGWARLEVMTGNVAVRRDFTDVRDVARAYRLLLERADPGEAVNVCSGRAVAMSELLSGLAAHTRVEVAQRTDPARVRAHEVMELRGSPERLGRLAGWRPEIPLEQTLRDALEWWRRELAGAGG